MREEIPTTPSSSAGHAPAHHETRFNDTRHNLDHGDLHAGPQPLAHANGHSDHSALATALEPALIAACDGRLSKIEWFRSTWQSGGAATGKASFELTEGRHADVVVKLPVGPAEYLWTTGMEGLDAPDGPHCELVSGCTPRVFAAGTELGGYDLAWLVVERLSGHPLSHHFDERAVHDLLAAAAEWYQRAAGLCAVDKPPPVHDWAGLLHKSREVLKHAEIAHHHRWVDAVKHVQKALPHMLARWHARPIHTWCHGDLHPGNAMHRAATAEEHRAGTPSRCVLIDLALVHAGHWVEDAIYLERLYWARPELLHGVKPVPTLAKLCKERGLHKGEDYGMLANIKRVLMGATSPAFLRREGNPRYVHAALEIVERLLPMVSK